MPREASPIVGEIHNGRAVIEKGRRHSGTMYLMCCTVCASEAWCYAGAARSGGCRVCVNRARCVVDLLPGEIVNGREVLEVVEGHGRRRVRCITCSRETVQQVGLLKRRGCLNCTSREAQLAKHATQRLDAELEALYADLA